MKEVVLTREEIDEICKRLAKELEAKFKGSEKVPVFIGVLKGACPFFMDLMRYYRLPCKIDYIQVSSYHGTSSTGVIHLKKELTEDVNGKDVVLVEDIIDAGLTLAYLKQYFEVKFNPKSITIVTLVDKKPLRKVPLESDYVGVTLNENKFLVGYGLDYKELVRNTECVYVPDKKELDEWDRILAKDEKAK